MGEIIGAIIIVLLLTLLFRKIVCKLFKCSLRIGTTISAIIVVVFVTFVALPNFEKSEIFLYPLAGIIVWGWLFFDLPIYRRKK